MACGITREQVFAALYQLLLTANFPFAIANIGDGRNMRGWQQLDGYQQPALFIQEMPQKAETPGNVPGGLGLNRWVYSANVWVYFRRDGTLTPTRINEVVDAIDDVILNPSQGMGVPQQLRAQNGGQPLVNSIRVTDAMWDEGFGDPIGGQVIIKVGLEIVTSRSPR